jgi:hypothetical protein
MGMGFDMKKYLLSGAILLTGCMQQPELKANFGPEVTQQQFSETFTQIKTPDIYSIRANEYAFAARQTWIEGQPYVINQSWGITVTKKVDQGDHYLLSLVEDLTEYNQGQSKPSNRKADRTLGKKNTPPDGPTTAATPNEQSIHAAVNEFALRGRHPAADMSPLATLNLPSHGLRLFHGRADSASGQRLSTMVNKAKITFHNLQLQQIQFPVPDSVRSQPNCGGLPPEKCTSLPAYRMSYDQVNWDENQGQKYTVTQIYVADVPVIAGTLSPALFSSGDPFIPGVVQACVNTSLPVKGQLIQVTQCDNVQKFTFGTP